MRDQQNNFIQLHQFDDLTSVSVDGLLKAGNWQMQYKLITQWGKLIHIKQAIRIDEYSVKGCETPAWLIHYFSQGIHRFAFDSDSKVINGIAALLLSQVDNKTTNEIAQVRLENMLKHVGLEKHLTPSRNNGIKMMIEKIYEYVPREN